MKKRTRTVPATIARERHEPRTPNPELRTQNSEPRTQPAAPARDWTIRRNGEITVDRAEGQAPKVSISVSSEIPILCYRYFNDTYQQVWEILDHSEPAINREYILNGLPLFDRHGGDQVALIPLPQIAKGKLGGAPEFCASQRAQDLKSDVEKLLRRNVSVDGAVDPEKYKLEGEKDGIPVIRATRWTPFGASFVGIPADPTVGVGREAHPLTNNQEQRIQEPSTKETPMPPEAKTEKIEREQAPAAPTLDLTANLTNRNKEIGEMLALAKVHNIAGDIVARAVSEGKSLADFQKDVLAELAKPKPNTVAREVAETDANIGLNKKEIKRYSFMNIIRGMNPETANLADIGFERECSQAVMKVLGKAPRGIYIPNDVLMDAVNGIRRTTGLLDVANTGGSYSVQTTLMTTSFIEYVRNRMVMVRAGAQVLSGLVGDISIPKQDGKSTAYWVTESNAPTTSNMTLTQVAGTPHTVGAYTDISRKLLLQSSLDCENLVRRDIGGSLAVEVDRANLLGTGSGQPTGLRYTSGIGNPSIATPGTPTYAEALSFPGTIMAANLDVETMQWLMPAAVWEKFAATPKIATYGSGFILDPDSKRCCGYPYQVSAQITAKHAFFGDWAQFIIAMWGSLDLLVHPNNDGTGSVRVTGFMDIDNIVRQASAFCYNATVLA